LGLFFLILNVRQKHGAWRIGHSVETEETGGFHFLRYALCSLPFAFNVFNS